jgi:transglutaminase-like putative cysteine protease
LHNNFGFPDMQIDVHHSTTYAFTAPQARLIQLLRVTPPSFSGQNVLEWSIDIDCDARMRSAVDGYGNAVTMLYVDGPVERIEIVTRGTVLTQDRFGVVTGTHEPLPPKAFLGKTDLTHADPAIEALAQLIRRRSGSPLTTLHGLMTTIKQKMRFDPGEGDPYRTAARAFGEGHGVCQDFAHIFCAAARTLGIPARYVSGHLYQRDGSPVQDASHAWAEAWVDDLGWTGFDVANGVCPDDAYIRVAIGLDYRAAAPLSGSRLGAGEEIMDVRVQVTQPGQ